MRNKKLKKAILSTISIFAFTGIILSANLDNISKLQSSFSSEYSLQNDGFKNENESSEIINSEIESISSSAPLAPPVEPSPTGTPTTITQNSVDTAPIIAGHFPFQLDRILMEKLVLITSVPSDFSIAENVDFDVSGVNNVAAPSDANKLQAGKAFINVSINYYYDSDGNLVKEGPGYAPLIGLVPISNFKSVASQTDYAQIPGFITSDWYASDVVADTVSIDNVLSINNGVTGINNATDTSRTIVSKVFNNKDGILDVKYTLQNRFNNKGEFIRASSEVRSISVSNFKNVTGATTLILKDDGTTNTLIPSNIVNQLELNFEGYTTWFELVHVPGTKEKPTGKITSIKDLVPDDINGTIKLTYTITGEYFDADLVKQMSGPEGNDFTVTISGMNSQVEKVDIIPFVIGGSVGGVVLIAAIVTTIMLVSKSKKKKSENLRKQKLSEKVTPPTGGVTKSTNPVPSSISGSSVVPGGPKPPVGPSGPMNRPVPPPIRK